MSRQPTYLLATATVPDRLVAEASKAEMILDVLPFIGIEYPDTKEEIENLLAQARTVIFTSVNAVNAVARWAKGVVPEWRIYCISGVTYAAVAEVFGEGVVVGKAGSAGELATVIRRDESKRNKGLGRSEAIVFFCGDRRMEELPAIGVTEKIVYRTVLTPQKLERDYDGIAFFSPSAVDSFFSVNSIGTRVPLFAIGKTTAEAIRTRCSNFVVIAGEPDKTVLIRKMIDFFLFKP